MTDEIFDKAFCIKQEIWGLENGLRQLKKVREKPLVNLSSCDIGLDADNFFKEKENMVLNLLVQEVEIRISQLNKDFSKI